MEEFEPLREPRRYLCADLLCEALKSARRHTSDDLNLKVHGGTPGLIRRKPMLTGVMGTLGDVPTSSCAADRDELSCLQLELPKRMDMGHLLAFQAG